MPFWVPWLFSLPCFLFLKTNGWHLFLQRDFNLHFFNPVIFQGGNLTEEYATLFLLMGILFAVAGKYCSFNPLLASPILGEECNRAPSDSERNPQYPILYNNILFLLSGLVFSLCVFTKEPYLFSVIPWFLYTVFPSNKEWKKSFIHGLFFAQAHWFPQR